MEGNVGGVEYGVSRRPVDREGLIPGVAVGQRHEDAPVAGQEALVPDDAGSVGSAEQLPAVVPDPGYAPGDPAVASVQQPDGVLDGFKYGNIGAAKAGSAGLLEVEGLVDGRVVQLPEESSVAFQHDGFQGAVVRRSEGMPSVIPDVDRLCAFRIGQQVAELIMEGLAVLEIRAIVRLESDGCYTTFYAENGERTLVTKNIKEFEKLLPAEKFARVHTSHIVNVDFVKKFLREINVAVMSDGSQVPISRRKKSEFLKMLWLQNV